MPPDRDVIWIASELRDVTMHPLQGGDLVQPAIVAGSVVFRFSRERRMGEPSQRADSVIDGDDHDLPGCGQCGSAVIAAANGPAAAMDVEHDGEGVGLNQDGASSRSDRDSLRLSYPRAEFWMGRLPVG